MPKVSELRSEALAGVPGAIGSVPDGMAAAVLAGVSPVAGLYASFAGPVAGGLSASTRRMVITTTSASALAAGSAVSGFSGEERAAALITLTMLAGAMMAGAAVLRLGRYTRFVSYSVMIGFLTGVAANIVFGQFPDLTGVEADGSSALAKATFVVTHPTQVDVAALLTGLTAIGLLLVVGRSRWSAFAAVVAVVVPTLATLGIESLTRVDSAGAIPTGLPAIGVPDVRLVAHPDVFLGALAVSVIVLIQGVGVSEAAPNPGGQAASPDGDFLAQGCGNLASAAFGGMPVGGSVGQTALNLTAGARGRWAAIFSGLWMLVILVAFAPVIGVVPMPTLAAILIVAAVASVRAGAILTIWRTGLASQIAIVTTFIATLFLPIAAAVGLGVALSLLLQLNTEAVDLRVVRLVRDDSGRTTEEAAPAHLPSGEVTVLDVYGSLFYAGARTLAARLPDPADSRRPAVVIRLRGRTRLGATSFVVLDHYASRLAERGGRLWLSGVDEALAEQFARGRVTGASGAAAGETLQVVPASAVVGASSERARALATAWLAAQPDHDR